MRTIRISKNPVTSLDSGIVREHLPVNWRHKISANIGFDTASFDLKGSKDELEELFQNGCSRRMTRFTPDGQGVIWDGYIAEMTLKEPGLNKRISLREMANGIIIRYIPTDTTTNPPTYGAETWTTPVDDAASQARYGIKQKVFIPPQNRLTNTDAAQYANVLLAHYRMPIRADDAALGTNEIGLSVICEGYMHALDWHTYIQWASSGTDNANTILSAIVSATGQGFIASQDFDTNTTQVQKYFLNYDTGYKLAQWIATLGDSSSNRWLAYVLEDRIMHYKAASTTVDYIQRIGDGRQEIFDRNGRSIPYWEVRPNHWMRTADIFPHALNPASLKDDFQVKFVESVEWSEPDGLTINGSPGDNLQVIIARMAALGDQML